MRYLEAREGHLYFRLVLPADVAAVCGQRAVRYRLPVDNRRAAAPFAALMSAAVDGIVRDVRTGVLSPHEAARRFGTALLAARDAAADLARSSPLRLRHPVAAVVAGASGRSMSLRDAWQEFEVERKASVAARTLVEIRSVGRRLIAALGGDTEVCAISRPMLVRVRDEWAREAPNASKGVAVGCIARGTLVKRMRLVGTFLRWCVERGWLDRNPAERIALPDESPQIERRGFTDAELRSVFAALADDPETHLLTRLATYTGCRLGELTGLRRIDVSRDDRQRLLLRLQPHDGRSLKSKSSARTVPVPTAIAAELEAWLKSRGDAPFERPAPVASKRFNRVLRRLNLPRELVFHSLRHGVAERLRTAGVARELIASILGHVNGTVTDHYAGPHGVEQKRAALELLHYEQDRRSTERRDDGAHRARSTCGMVRARTTPSDTASCKDSQDR